MKGFSGMPNEQVQALTFEIGRDQGKAVNL